MTDQTESASEVPTCSCGEYWPRNLHHPDCAVVQLVRALESKVRRLEYVNDEVFTEIAKRGEERDRLAREVERIRVQLDEAIARIEDMLEDDDGQAFKEAGKFLLRIKGRDDES